MEDTDSKSHNMQNVELFGDSFWKKALHVDYVKQVQYNKNLIQIGRRRGGGIYYLDLGEPCRILVIGMNGSGKTFLCRGILNRLKKAGMSVFIPTDIKDEFHSNVEPLQSKFHKLLLTGENPNPEKVIILRPTFFKQTSGELKTETNNVWYSPDLTKMNKDDFMTFFRLSELKAPQQAALEFLYRKFSEEIKKENWIKKFKFDVFNEWLDEVPDINSSTKTSLRLRFASLYESHFYEPQYKINLTQKIKEGYTIAMNLEGYEQFIQGNFLYVHGIIGITIRELIDARRKKLINRLMIFLEEAPRFIANIMVNSSVKKIAEESYDVDRRYGVDWLTVTQDMMQMSDKVINQSRYLFVPATIPFEPFKQCFISFGMANSSQNAATEAMRLYKQMSPNRREWMAFDRVQRSTTIFTPLAPLSKHAEAVE